MGIVMKNQAYAVKCTSPSAEYTMPAQRYTVQRICDGGICFEMERRVILLQGRRQKRRFAAIISVPFCTEDSVRLRKQPNPITKEKNTVVGANSVWIVSL